MSLKNLNVSNKTHKFLIDKLKIKKIFHIYKEFEKNLNLNQDFIVAVSGGPDSLALSFLAKIYSIDKSLKANFFLVDHKLRYNSSEEANFVKKLLKKLSIKLNILKWYGKKPRNNIQSIARVKRYALLTKKSKKLNTNHILFGHHKDDLIENFFIRMLRGSGLNGMLSFDEKSKFKKITVIRPLIKFSKQDLIFISKKVFDTYIEDPSNKNENFKRIKIRNLIKTLKSEGLNFEKFNLTIKNLKFANDSIKFFTQNNIIENSISFKKKKSIFLNKEFFNKPEEIVFRSLTEIIQIVGGKYYPARGKKIDKTVELIRNKAFFKITLGNCLIKKINNTIVVSKED
jgi:tRNA(Ile)-lysidine synthase